MVARYHRARGTHDQGWPISRSLLNLPPERLLNEVTDSAEYDDGALRSWVTHSLSANWRLRGGLNVSIADYNYWFQTFRLPANSDLGVNGVLLNRLPITEQGRSKEYIGQFDLAGEFHTGTVRHRLATGLESTWNYSRSTPEKTALPGPNICGPQPLRRRPQSRNLIP